MNIQKPKVSILVPVYGVESRIERCAISLFEQTYDNIEYIFVNDKTPDHSIDVLNEVIKRYSNRSNFVKIIEHKKNSGLAVARNTAVDNSSGDFVIHVDSDDHIDINTVKILVEKQQEKDYDIVVPEYLIYHPTYTDYWKVADIENPQHMAIEILKRNILVSVAGRLIRRSLYYDNNIKAMENINMGEDYSVSPLLYYFAQKVSTVHHGLYHYDCTNESSYTATFSENKSYQVWEVINYLEDFFKEKDNSYLEAIEYAKVAIIVQQMKACSINGNNPNYHSFLKNKLTKIKTAFIKDLSFVDRCVLSINNYQILSIYTKFAYIIKQKIKKYI